MRIRTIACTTALICICAGSRGLSQDTTPARSGPTTEQAENALGMYAKLLCSGIFVCGREPHEFIANDLGRAGLPLPGFEQIDVSVDRNRRAVTLKYKSDSEWSEAGARTAIYHDAQGSTLLPRDAQEVFFKPVKVSSALPPADSQPWPMGDVLPKDALPPEVDVQALETALDHAFDATRQAIPQKTRAMVVVYRGRLIAERYAPGFDQNSRHISWSMGKSITAALAGLLVRDGHVKVDDPAPIPEWRQPGDPRGDIKIRDLLRMSSGLRFGRGNPADGTYLTAGDEHTKVYFDSVNVFEFSTQRDLEFLPNTKWQYHNCDPLALGKIVRDVVEAQGEEYLSFPQRRLFDAIGARNFVLEPDAWENFILTGFDYGTARDWVRFGMLHLQDGVFAGERVLPAEWIKFVSTPAPAHPRQGYGGLFWLNAGGAFDSLPRDMYWPAGHHGQSVFIIPSRELVIVRLGHSARGGYDEYIEPVLSEILAAVGKAGEN